MAVDDIGKLTPEYNNVTNISRDQRSTSNVVQLEGKLYLSLSFSQSK